MSYLLLVDYSLFAVIQRMTKAQRCRFETHLRKIQIYPGNYADYTQIDKTGRLLHVSLFNDLAIYFWIDEADRHIKILRIAKRETGK